MASETNELTFVRCPSCRSLVPASAARCRICNNPIDGASKGEGSEGARANTRVRQKTIAASADDLLRGTGFEAATGAGALNDNDSGDDGDDDNDTTGKPVALGEVVGQLADGEDPLADFLEDFDDPQELDEIAAPEPVSREARADEDLEQDLATDLDQDLDQDLDDDLDSDLNSDPDDDHADGLGRDFDLTPQPVAPREVVKDTERVKQVVKAPQRQADLQPPVRQVREAPEPVQRANVAAPEGGRKAAIRGGAPEAKRNEAGVRKVQDMPAKVPHPAEVSHVAVAGPKTGKMRPGRLFGWLVSFENPDGRAIELREGKFFVTGSPIRGSDLVIEDASISTPHALISISFEHGLMIQDLMSERGVFVRSGVGGQYRREEGVIELQHGDWIRFGDVEFLLTAVPVGR